MSGPGAFVSTASIAAVEAAFEKLQLDKDWAAFKAENRTGDHVVYFRNSDARWRVMAGAEGYAIVRSGKVIHTFLVAMN
jgi:hypothetical protein